MSNIAIKGAATGSGTFTLEAPATSTNRTLTLPDEAGTVLTRAAGSPDNSLVVNSAGNVGIGTSSPDNKLTLASGYVQTGNGTGAGGGVWFPYGADAGTRTWRLRSDFAAYGDWGIEQSTTRTGTTFVTKFLIDPSGNVGINTSVPARTLHVKAGGVTTLANSNGALFTDAGNAGVLLGSDNVLGYISGVDLAGTAVKDLLLQPFGGNVMVGRTSPGGTAALSVEKPANTATYIYQMKAGQVECTWGFKASTDSNMYIGSGSTAVGTYGVYLTNTGNSWNAVSDERMKTIVEPITNAAEKVSSLRTVIGYYNNDDNQIRRPFLIAQDVQAVLPEAVNVQDPDTGTLGMSYTDTIPLLVAAIKEQQVLITQQAAAIETLTARVSVLEAK